jgi:hypothetical protein
LISPSTLAAALTEVGADGAGDDGAGADGARDEGAGAGELAGRRLARALVGAGRDGDDRGLAGAGRPGLGRAVGVAQPAPAEHPELPAGPAAASVRARLVPPVAMWIATTARIRIATAAPSTR